jgi:hypothetical protein
MSIKAIGYNINKEEEEKIIIPMAQIVSSDIVDVFDLRSVKPDVSADDIVFVFGEKTSRMMQNIPCKIKLEFPDLPKLDRRFGEEDLRRQALEQLLRLKKALSTGNILNNKITECTNSTTHITTEALPSLTSQEVLQQLENTLRREGIKEWIGTTSNGKIVRLTVDREMNEAADINMTFAELFAMKIAMEALQVKELEIVYRSNLIRKSNS